MIEYRNHDIHEIEGKFYVTVSYKLANPFCENRGSFDTIDEAKESIDNFFRMRILFKVEKKQ